MLSVQLEPKDTVADFRNPRESCTFCKAPTQHWHLISHSPVCEACAKLHEETDLPARAQERMKHRRLIETVRARIKADAQQSETSRRNH